MNRLRRKLQGFTLPDLLVVLASLAILVASGISMAFAAQRDAKLTQVLADTKQIVTQTQRYHTDKGTYPANGSLGLFTLVQVKQWRANAVGVAGAATITEFSLPTAFFSSPQGITAGPDGALWFTEVGANKIGRITTAGSITEFAIPASNPTNITAGPDGALWFTEVGANKIGRITTAGSITEFSLPTIGSGPQGITAGPDGALWFTEVFANKIGRITTGSQETTAFVTRLYEQVLNREPDAAGLQAFVQQIQQFGSVVPTVLAFFHSQEFLARNTTNEQFLTILYHTFLDRDPDQADFTAFLTSLQLGQLTRDNLLDIFMDSAEFATQASFLAPQDPVTAFVSTLYVRILGRGPDQAGLQGFVAEAQRACTTLPTVQTLLASPEFQARLTTNTEFVTLLYRVFLGRVPDAAGLTTFVTTLTQGTVTRDQLVAQFAASAEFQAIQQHLFPPERCSPTVSLTVGVGGVGVVTSNPGGINCAGNTGTCEATFPRGTTVTLTAQSSLSVQSGGSFDGWGGDCAAIGTRDSQTQLYYTDNGVYPQSGSHGLGTLVKAGYLNLTSVLDPYSTAVPPADYGYGSGGNPSQVWAFTV